ncbi:MAG: hypothetical protein ACLR6J_14295 [Parabacteroides merdae]
MNVAITRAHMKLMILGDAPTLTRHAFYKELYEYIWENGQVITVQPPSRHDPLIVIFVKKPLVQIETTTASISILYPF